MASVVFENAGYRTSEEDVVRKWGCIPRRYITISVLFICYMILYGYRTVLAMSFNHVSGLEASERDSGIYPDCTTVSNDSFRISWSSSSISYLNTLYYLGACFTQIPAAMLATRFSPKKVLIYGSFVIALTYFVMPWAMHGPFVITVIFRVVQGILELGIVPASYVLVTAWAPTSEKTKFMMIVSSGAYFSPAIAMILGGATACYISWDSGIYIYAACGVAWCVVAWFVLYDNPQEDPTLSPNERLLFADQSWGVKSSSKNLIYSIPWRSIFTSGPVYALVVGEFCKDMLYGMVVVELQDYFTDAFDLNTSTVGTLSGIPDALTGVFAIIGGILCDCVRRRNIASTTTVRKSAETIGFGTEAICLMAIFFANTQYWQVAFGVLCLGIGISGVALSGYEANYMDLAPKYTAIISGVSRIGVIGPVLSTALIAEYIGDTHSAHRWNVVFLICGIVHFVGAIVYAIFASGELQPWADGNDPEETRPLLDKE